MNNLVKTDLSKICSKVTDGTHDSPKILKKGIPFIKGKHLINGQIDFDNCDYISLDDHEKVIKRSKVEKGDILFSNIGSVGASAYVKTEKEFSIKNVALFKPNKELIDNRYLYYLITSPIFIKGLLNKKQGVAQPFLSLKLLRNHEFYYFEKIKYQKKIASVLLAYDKLIENNTRRIEILEEMAQRIYKEWIVNFKYPGHENDKLVDSELGMIPEGWCVNKIGDLLSLEYGKSLTKNKRIDGDVPVFGSSGIVGYHNAFLAKGPCVIVGRAGNAGDVHFSLDDFYPVDSTFYINRLNKDLSQYYLFYLFNELNLKSIVSGSAVPGINRNHIYLLQVPIPTIDLLNEFNKIIIPIFEMINTIKNLNKNLIKTRDHLLPKLVSGKVDVSDLDIDTSILYE